MTTYTSRLALPKPEATESLAAGYDAIGDLADAVEQAIAMPRCRAYRVAAVSPAHNTTPLLTLDGEMTPDADAMHDLVTNPSRVKATEAGLYLVIAQVTWAANATGSRVVRVAKNNAGGAWSSAAAVIDVARTALGSFADVVNVTQEVDLAVNDYLELYSAQTSGAALALAVGLAGGGAPQTYLSMRRIA